MASELELVARALRGETEAVAVVEALVAALKVSPEARQLVLQRVLVERRLEEFAGRGALRQWLKTVAQRIEVDLRRSQREETLGDDVLARLLPPSGHEEKEVITRESKALGALDERERLFVQHHLLDGLSLSAIAKLYRVAPSTVMRSIDRSLTQLRTLVREHLTREHRLGVETLASLERNALE